MEHTNNVKLDGKQAATFLGISYSAYTKLVARYFPELETYISKEKGDGKKRKTHITKQGLVLLATLKNESRPNQYKKEVTATFRNEEIQEAKVALVEKVSQPSLPAEYLNDPVIAMRMEQIKMSNDIKELKEWKDSISEDLESKPLDSQQRAFMNSKVRGLGFALGVDISRVWSKLHKNMNKATINDYKFLDYKPTMDLLKEWYRGYNVEWEADELI
jgi:hypothetical protein